MTAPARPADQAVRDRVASDFDTTILLEAGAGTGKTTTLVERIVALLRSGRVRIDRLAAITFTEKAAAELKLRLRDALESRAGGDPGERERLRDAAADLDRAQVSTIHSFALALLQERPFEAGLDPAFRVAADVVGERSFDDGWNEWLDEQLGAGDPILVEALHVGLKLDDLREAARQVVADRDILGRPVPMPPPIEPEPLRERVLEKAADLARLATHCLDLGDGALASIRYLEAFADRAARAEGLALASLLRTLRPNTQRGRQQGWDDKQVLKLVKSELKALRDEAEQFGRDVESRLALALRNRLTGFLTRHQQRQREAGLVDFQGLLLESRNLVRDHTPVRRYFQERFDALLIDEFQDTDPLQVELAFYLAEDPTAEPARDWREVRLLPGKLFLVGDPRQSIYRFRRADLGVYQQARDHIARSGGVVLHLTSSFRSVPSIVQLVNRRFEAVFRTDPEHDPEPVALTAERPEVHAAGARVLSLPIPVTALAEDPGDDRVDTVRPLIATAIAGFVEEVTRTRPWSIRDGDRVRAARPGDVGLLLRQLTGIEHLEAALRARGVAFRLVGGKAYHQRGEVAQLRATLAAVDNAADRLALVQALRSPFFGLSDAELAAYVARGGVLNVNAPVPEALEPSPVASALGVLQRLHRQRRIDPPSHVVRGLLERTRALPGFLLAREGEQAVANLWKVVELAQAWEAAGPATLRGFVRFLADQARDARQEGDSPVGDEARHNAEILTVHAAKGLEYPIVVLADILAVSVSRDKAFLDHQTGEGWLKVGRAEPPGFGERRAVERRRAEAEERRLLYVALTRARDHLVVPVLPLEREKPVTRSWALPVLRALAPAGEPAWGAVVAPRESGDAAFTCLDSRGYFPAPAGEPGPRPAEALEGDAQAQQAAAAQERAWEAERRRRREAGRARSAPEAIAATELAEGAGQLALPLDEDAAGFGRLVHALLAGCALDGSDLAERAPRLAREHGMDGEAAESAVARVRATLRGPLFERVRRSQRVLREVPLQATLDGKRMRGVVDLAFRDGAGWTLVEYKTSPLAGGPAAQAQARLYGRAFQAVVGEPVRVEVCVVADPAAG